MHFNIIIVEPSVERNASFSGILFYLIKSSSSESISTNQTSFPVLLLVMVGQLQKEGGRVLLAKRYVLVKRDILVKGDILLRKDVLLMKRGILVKRGI